MGRRYLGYDENIEANSLVFITMVRKLFPAIISGLLLSAVLAAAMSTADSQLLAAASAFASDVYKPVIRKDQATDKEMLWAGRWVVLAIAVIAMIIAASPGAGSIMSLVSNAWGVFGAAFGPVILLSLFWKRFTFSGAVAGIVVGAAVDILWLAFLSSTGIYEILPGAVAGINAGDGMLPFAIRQETIIPVTVPPGKDDLTPQFNGGAVKGDEASMLRTTAWRSGKSLVVDFFAPAGKVTEVSAGTACEARVVKSFSVPYLAYGDGDGRLKIDLLEGGWYRSAVFDWYRSNASLPGHLDGAFTMRYLPKTDGSYNPVSERLVITVSRDFADVLPEIPNPVSPYKAVTGKNAWRAHASFEHAFDRMFWREVKRRGIDHVVINDHETLWRDRGESFTFRTDAAPGRGGDSAAADSNCSGS